VLVFEEQSGANLAARESWFASVISHSESQFAWESVEFA
jgi:hypothetical protein